MLWCSRTMRTQRKPMNPQDAAPSAAEVRLASPRFLTGPLSRHWHLRWGATDAEVAAILPGDNLVPGPSFTATRAITIAAPPQAVWPWIVQIGTGRGGFYADDLFDNRGAPQRRPHPARAAGHQVGDGVPMSSKVNERTAVARPADPQSKILPP
jgi:hypothetical protein